MGLLHGLDLGVRLVVHGLVAPPGVIQQLLLRCLKLPDLGHLQVRVVVRHRPYGTLSGSASSPRRGQDFEGAQRRCHGNRTRSDLLGSHQQQLRDGGGGGHGVPVHAVDLEGPGHAPHPLVGGQDLLVADHDPLGVFNCGGRGGEKGRLNGGVR